MDSQRNDFKTLIETQFAFLVTDRNVDNSALANAFEIIQPRREKLNGFATSVYELLVGPRFNIVASQFHNQAKHQIFGNDAVLLIEPSEAAPDEAKFCIKCELFLPAQAISFSYDYRITTGEANYCADDWIRFTIPTFNQTKFCNWLEEALIQFIESYTKRSH